MVPLVPVKWQQTSPKNQNSNINAFCSCLKLNNIKTRAKSLIKSVINSKSNSTLSKYNKNECAVVKKFKTPTQQSVHSTPDIERLDVGHFTGRSHINWNSYSMMPVRSVKFFLCSTTTSIDLKFEFDKYHSFWSCLLQCNNLFKLHFTVTFNNIYLNSKSPAMWAALLCKILCKVNKISDISLPLRTWIFSFSGVVGMLLLYFPVFVISKKYMKWRA